MKRTTVCNMVIVAISLASLSSVLAAAPNEELRAEAEKAISAIKSADSALTNFFDGAAGYAVFPSVGKGGIIVGGEHGKGLVYEKGKAVGEAALTEVNVGPQIGGQSFFEVLFFETAEALTNFKQGNLEMSAEVSAVAAAEGAALTTNYRKGVVVFTLPRNGLMAQATIGGQKFSYKPLE